MSGWENPAVVGLIIGIPTFILGWLGYRRAIKVDKSAENAAVIAAQTGSVGQVIAGLNQLIENLQDDNKVWRESFKEISVKLAEVIGERDDLQKECDALKKKYNISNGENGR